MRVAVISDIHGNLVSLEAVLRVLDSERIDSIVCLGDVAATGPQPHQVIERLRSMRCPVVMGNADAWLLNPSPDSLAEEDENAKHIVELNLWCSKQLAPTDLDYIRSFPSTHDIALDYNLEMLCCHGSPQSNTDRILATIEIPVLQAMLSNVTAEIVACGHTHIQMLRRYMNQILINPGSVGLPYDVIPNLPGMNAEDAQVRNPPWAEYAIISSTNHGLEVDFRRTPIDLDALIHAAVTSGMPDPQWWTKDWK
jgi:putative phosphoesterase